MIYGDGYLPFSILPYCFFVILEHDIFYIIPSQVCHFDRDKFRMSRWIEVSFNFSSEFMKTHAPALTSTWQCFLQKPRKYYVELITVTFYASVIKIIPTKHNFHKSTTSPTDLPSPHISMYMSLPNNGQSTSHFPITPPSGSYPYSTSHYSSRSSVWVFLLNNILRRFGCQSTSGRDSLFRPARVYTFFIVLGWSIAVPSKPRIFSANIGSVCWSVCLANYVFNRNYHSLEYMGFDGLDQQVKCLVHFRL